MTNAECKRRRVVGWDASHSEFLIEDYYYFSKLKRIAEKEGIEIHQVDNFNKLEEYDVIVFNYPEERFESWEIKKIWEWLKAGKRLIFTSYYKNMDSTAENINNVFTKLEIPVRINNDVVIDPENNAGDMMFPIARYDKYKVVMPCTSSITAQKNCTALVISSDKALAKPTGFKKPVLGVKFKMKGEIIALGTCVFWDNHCIELENNKMLASDLLKL